MGNFQRKAGTTFDFVQDYANQPIIMNSSEPVSSLPDSTMLEISGDLLAPDGTVLMQTQNSQDELSSVLSQLGLPESYVTNQLNSNSAGLSYLQSLNPEILGVIQNPSDEAIRAEFVDSHYDGEMKETDKLNPAKLSAQCNSYTEKLNQENLSLDALYTTFYNASAVDLEGKTAGAFLEQCENYCIIIECLQMANYCDIEDNTKLYNRLGYIYLDGEVIIPGRVEAIDNWNKCIDKRNTCNYLAGLTDDDDDRDRLHSEARYWQGMADSYYAEWERLTKLKEEFEDVNAFSKSLYTGNAEQFRSFAYQGMQLVGYAFKAGKYTMQGGVDDWRKNALQIKQDCLVEISNQWKTADGEWDMEALGKEISIDDDSLSELDYLALCYVIETEGFIDAHMEEFLEKGIIGEFQPAESVNVDSYIGTWNYRPSMAYQKLLSTYERHLQSKLLYTGERSELITEFQTYNILYAGANVLQAGEFGGYSGDADVFECGLYGDRVDFSIKREEKDGYCYYQVGYDINTVNSEAVTKVEPVVSNSCRVYDDSGSIGANIHNAGQGYIRSNELGEGEIAMAVAQNILTNSVKEGISTGLEACPATAPIMYGAEIVNSSAEILKEEEEKKERNTTIINLENTSRAFEAENIGGSVIVTDDGKVTVTSYYIQYTGVEGLGGTPEADVNKETGEITYVDANNTQITYSHRNFVEEYLSFDANERIAFDELVTKGESAGVI